MEAFFICIILIGSGITLFAFFLMLAEKRRLHDYRTDVKEKKEDLIKVIEDAEELVSEMNRFSDYVVTQIEEKHARLTDSIKEADLRVDLLTSPEEVKEVQKVALIAAPLYDQMSIEKIIEEEKPTEPENDMSSGRKGKVLTFDVKRREILKLAKMGLDSTEIARLLNCGKGEIELIARMGRSF